AGLSADYEFIWDDRDFSLDLTDAALRVNGLKLSEKKQAGIPNIAVGAMALHADYRIRSEGQETLLDVGKIRLNIGDFAVQGTKNSPGVPNIAVNSVDLNAEARMRIQAQDTHIDLSQVSLTLGDVAVVGTRNSPGIPMIGLKQLAFSAQSTLALSDEDVVFNVDHGKATLHGIALSEQKNKDKVIKVSDLAVDGIRVDSKARDIETATIQTGNATVKVWLDSEGTLNFEKMFSVPKAKSDTLVEAPDKEAAWHIRTGKVSLANYKVLFTDNTQERPVAVSLSELNAELDHYTNASGARLPLRFRTRINRDGRISSSGTAVLSPLSVMVDLQLDEIGMKTVQPYLDPFVRLDLIDGNLNVRGKLVMNMANSDEPDLKFSGNADIAQLRVRDKIHNKDFVKWNNLELDDIDVDLKNQSYSISQAVFDRPYIRVVINKNGTTNFDQIVIDQPAEKKKTGTPAKASASVEPAFKVGNIRLKQGRSDFADYSLILPFIAQMNRLNGTLNGLSSNRKATAKLALKGKVYDLADVDIAGRYRIDTGDSAFDLHFKNMPLPLATPYMAEFAGYKIEKGQMSLDLSYTIKDKQLEAQNNLFIDQLTLGEEVENPNAVSLPLKLAIALMKDANGKIELDLPITGSLDDPEFSVMALAFKALENLIGKIIASPFQAIASLVGEDRDMSVVTFEPGSAELTVDEQAKLGDLAKALEARPALKLEIKGAAYQDQDWPAMRFDALKDQLKIARARELKEEGQKVRAEYVKLSDVDFKRLLAKAFIEKFPLLAEYSLFGNPQLKNPDDGDFYKIARSKMEEIMAPEQQRLEELAMERAGNIAKYVIEQGGVASDRVFVLAAELDPETETPGINASLSLDIAR
ncbi:MAG: DUF748 domain-containing protein, partial [Gammaproteobacteria bacterium]